MKRDFIAVSDFSPQEIKNILDLAVSLKKEWLSGGNPPLLKGKVLAMIFQKPSLRTRVSFDMAMRHLGGDALYLSPNEIGLGKREAIGDIAQVLSGYVQVIMARVFEHNHVLELAKYASVPVINGLSDYNHPCQAMADALTIIEKFGSLEGLNVSFIGDGNNVAVSLMHISLMLGANFSIATPKGYELNSKSLEKANDLVSGTNQKIKLINDPSQAVENAHVIYTDTWISMGQEDEKMKRENVFAPFQVNKDLISMADPEVIVMHCLPAHRGQEITDEVADGPHSVLFPQAHNRLHAQKAVLVDLLQKSY